MRNQMLPQQRQTLTDVLRVWQQHLGYDEKNLDRLSEEQLLIQFDACRSALWERGEDMVILSQRQRLLDAGILLPQDRISITEERTIFQKAADWLRGKKEPSAFSEPLLKGGSMPQTYHDILHAASQRATPERENEMER